MQLGIVYNNDGEILKIKGLSDFMRPKAIDVKPLEDYMLLVIFENGEKKIFDVKPYLTHKAF